MMQAIEPTRPRVCASSSLTSMSQRPSPWNQEGMSSVGQMRALMTFMRFAIIIQKTRAEPGMLRFLMCQKNVGTERHRAMNDRRGIAMAPGETPSIGTKESIDAAVFAIEVVLFAIGEVLLDIAMKTIGQFCGTEDLLATCASE